VRKKEDSVPRVSFITENDELFKMFGMQLEEAREGYCKLSSVVKQEYINAYGVAHGAYIFALADMAFAIAASSIADAVAVQWSLNMFRAAGPGETVHAECIILHRGKSVIVVGFNVTNEAGKVLARGQATSLPVELERFEK
jgi:acyl-CoA thioesterase